MSMQLNVTPEMQWHFITFGSGSFKLHRAAKRIVREASNSGFFVSAKVYNSRKLKKQFPVFWKQHEPFISTHPRGFGYWLWKPFLINSLLNSLPNNSGIVYLDAGCHLNLKTSESRKRFSEYFELAENNGSLTTKLFSGSFGIKDLKESSWTRKIVIESLGVSGKDCKSSQIQAGILFLTNNDQNKKLTEQWFSFCIVDDYSFLLDAKPNENNFDGFIEHRHDQSIFSCLSKKEKIFSIKDETYWAPNWEIDGANFPIWAMRHKSGINPSGPDFSDLLDRVIEFPRRFQILKKLKHALINNEATSYEN